MQGTKRKSYKYHTAKREQEQETSRGKQCKPEDSETIYFKL